MKVVTTVVKGELAQSYSAQPKADLRPPVQIEPPEAMAP